MAKQVDMRPGERIIVNGPAVVELVYKCGSRARVAITAPEDTTITYMKTPAAGATEGS